MTSKILFALCLLFSGTAQAQTKTSDAVMKEFMNQRFGMFIHWGPVTLRGTEIGWSRDREVPKDDYDSLYKEFNPVLFNADAWVKAAKDAGMKYLTITARHHDGFCLWPTKYTSYHIANTPFKKDVVGALYNACKKQGIKFCIYYSVLDWWHPDYPMHSPHNKPTPDPKSDMKQYVVYVKNQLKELIENYHPYMLWFDGQWESPWTNELGKDIYDYVHTLNPNIITNNRLGKEFSGVDNLKIDHTKMIGDYDTPEQVIGKMNMETPWESCFTICNQWAWKPNDKMKSLKECLSILSKTAGGNGNLLLNVGPMPDGRIEARQVARLKEIGDWLKTNGTAVYGTLGGPYVPTNTYASSRKGNKIFVHVLKTDTSVLELKNIPDRKILKSYTMQGTTVPVEKGAGTFKINLPAQLAAQPEYIVVLEMDGNVEKVQVIQ